MEKEQDNTTESVQRYIAQFIFENVPILFPTIGAFRNLQGFTLSLFFCLPGLKMLDLT